MAEPILSVQPAHSRTRMVAAEIASRGVRPLAQIILGKGQVLFREGDPAVSVFEVLSGAMKISKLLPDGRQQIVEIAVDGWVCGFSRGDAYDATCQALTGSVVLVHPRCSLQGVLGLDLKQARLAHQIERQMCALHDHTLSLGRKSAKERVVTLLMRFVPARGIENCRGPSQSPDGASIRLPISRKEIADYLGLTLETVSRTLTELQREGIVARGEKREEFRIHDVCRMCRAAQIGC